MRKRGPTLTVGRRNAPALGPTMKTTFATLALAAAAYSAANTYVATFDDLNEGDFGPSMASGGVKLYDVDQDLGGGDNFTIEDASAGGLGGSFSSPNVCGFGGYVPGSGVAFGRMKSFSIGMAGTGFQLKKVSLDIWTFLLQAGGNTITLEGWFGNTLVNSDSYTPGTFVVEHHFLTLPTDDYDKFVVRAQGSVDHGVVFADVDNVRVDAIPVPEPATLAALGLGGLMLLRKSAR